MVQPPRRFTFVEQEATHAKLRAIGVDFAQGYYFGMPGPAPS
jgi:EAL domain-containing protein (putative c-di-GMP-specific phosphodiesterase class I)